MIKKYYLSLPLIIATILMLSLGSCDPAKKYEKAETEAIANFIASNPADTFKLESSGLYYRDVLVGTGSQAVANDTAYVQYTGKFLDGTIFDSNVGQADLVFPVGQGLLIYGFDEAITYMREGGKSEFIVPSKLGYGPQGYNSIPGYTALLYDVQLDKLVPAKKK